MDSRLAQMLERAGSAATSSAQTRVRQAQLFLSNPAPDVIMTPVVAADHGKGERGDASAAVNPEDHRTPMELMMASLSQATGGIAANRIERRERNAEATARPVTLEHRLKVTAEHARARQAWTALYTPAQAQQQQQQQQQQPPPPPPPIAASADVEMVSGAIDDQKTHQSRDVKQLVLSDCLDATAKSRCFHEVTLVTRRSNGQIEHTSYGWLAGCYIATLADLLSMNIPTEWIAHIDEQGRANVDRLQQPYRKLERKTRPGTKRKKPTMSSDTSTAHRDTPVSGDGMVSINKQSVSIFGKASIKPQRRKSRAGIGGRRSGTATSKHRMKTFVRVLVQFPLTPRNSVHKGTTVPVDDMFELRDVGVGAYHPLTFPAVQFRTPDPHGTVSAMESGELSVSSAPSEDEALILAMQQVLLTTLQFNKPAILENFGAANITASAGLGWAINLDKLANFVENHAMFKNITYDKTLFPGLHWTLKQPAGVVLGFFELGFVNAVGLKADAHFKYVRDVILPDIILHRDELENKQKTQTALPLEQSKEEYTALCEHVDKTMEEMS